MQMSPHRFCGRVLSQAFPRCLRRQVLHPESREQGRVASPAVVDAVLGVELMQMVAVSVVVVVALQERKEKEEENVAVVEEEVVGDVEAWWGSFRAPSAHCWGTLRAPSPAGCAASSPTQAGCRLSLTTTRRVLS